MDLNGASINLQESFSNSFEINKPSDFAKHLKDQICRPSTRFLQEQRDTVVHSPQKNNSCVEKLHILNLCCPAKRCGFESLYQTGFAPYPQIKSSASSSVAATLTLFTLYILIHEITDCNQSGLIYHDIDLSICELRHREMASAFGK